MGNSAVLTTSIVRDSNNFSIALPHCYAANWIIPLCWSALFRPDDVLVGLMPVNEDDDPNLADPPTQPFANVLAEAQQAAKLLEMRRGAILAHVGHDWAIPYDRWAAHVAACPAPFLKLVCHQIQCLHDPLDGFPETLRRSFSSFETGDPAEWHAVLDLAGIPSNPTQGTPLSPAEVTEATLGVWPANEPWAMSTPQPHVEGPVPASGLHARVPTGTPLDGLGWPTPLVNCLSKSNVRTLEALVSMQAGELLALNGFRVVFLREVRNRLSAMGKSLSGE